LHPSVRASVEKALDTLSEYHKYAIGKELKRIGEIEENKGRSALEEEEDIPL